MTLPMTKMPAEWASLVGPAPETSLHASYKPLILPTDITVIGKELQSGTLLPLGPAWPLFGATGIP